MYYPYNMMNYGYYSPFHLIGTVVTVIFWIIVIVVILKLLKGARKGHHDWHWGDRNAVNILRERYAKGEISKEEYEERKKTLETK